MLLLPPRHSQTYTRTRWHEGQRGIGSGCEIHSAREGRRHTNCIKYRTSARTLPLESPARGCSGSKFLCALGPAVQGRSSRAPSPARPSLDLDHRLALCSLSQPLLSLSSPSPLSISETTERTCNVLQTKMAPSAGGSWTHARTSGDNPYTPAKKTKSMTIVRSTHPRQSNCMHVHGAPIPRLP